MWGCVRPLQKVEMIVLTADDGDDRRRVDEHQLSIPHIASISSFVMSRPGFRPLVNLSMIP